MSAAAIWIWFCAYLNCAGWTLSALHQLNRTGYVCAFAIGLGALLFWKKKSGASAWPKIHAPKLAWRFKKIFPAAFLALAALAFLGGALHPVSNYDTLAYRTPRVLHWLAAEQWHWVQTDFQRLNTRTAGFEWLTAPQFLFFRTDHLVFLLNIVSFLLLPGRIFAVLTRLGVRPRAAWHWMWLFPSGYGYVLEAGGAVNDMAGGVFALAAFEFVLRAAREKNPAHFWTGALAAALMTAVKAFNLILLLPWGIAALPALPLLLRRPLATAAVAVLAATASLIPTAALNIKNCGDWTGLKAEQATIGGGGKLLRLAANAVCLPLSNLAPPIFPCAKQWNNWTEQLLPPATVKQMLHYMEPGLAMCRLTELQVEESAGLGLGVTALLLGLLAKKIRAGEILSINWLAHETLVLAACWLVLLLFMMQVGSAGPSRYLLPFYVLLAAPILRGRAAAGFFRARFWRGAAVLVFAVAALLVVITPARPLWPAVTLLEKLDAGRSSHAPMVRAWNVYSAYGSRADGFQPVLSELPADAEPLGFMAFDEPEAALWRPFGSRTIRHIRYDDPPASVRERGIKYALVSEEFLAQHHAMQPAEWKTRMNAETVQVFDLKMLAGQPAHRWWLLRFN